MDWFVSWLAYAYEIYMSEIQGRYKGDAGEILDWFVSWLAAGPHSWKW